MQVQEYLISKKIEFKRRGEEAITNCLTCEDTKQKMSINLITGLWQCFHGSCGATGNFYDLQKLLGDVPQKLSNDNSILRAKKKTYVVPDQDIPKMTNEQVNVYRWLKGRRFTDETMKYFRVGAKKDTVVLPFFKNGILVNKKSRNVLDKKIMSQEKDAEPTLFNRDNISSKILIITEGEFDCMALHQYGIESVSVPNGCQGTSWIDTEWDYLETFERILLCFDSDSAGQIGAKNVANKLGLWRCGVVKLPYKDANECLMKDVPPEEIYKCFHNPQEFAPETIVSPSEFSSRINYLFEQGANLFGTKTAWTELDVLLKGWRGGEVTIWTGKSGAGKSTALNQHFLDIGDRGEKSCIYSGEMSPDRYLRWAIIQRTMTNSPSKIQINGTLDWMDDKIYILNVTSGIEPEALLKDFEYAARRYEVKHFIIDSLMKIKFEGTEKEEYNKQKDFVSSLCDFAKKFNVHVHLVAHPRKTATDRDEPGKVDVKGTGHITDLADNVLVLYRLDETTKEKMFKKKKKVSDCILFVKKNREYGVEGSINLFFDEKSKTFKTDKGESE
jgi:twinkle protein